MSFQLFPSCEAFVQSEWKRPHLFRIPEKKKLWKPINFRVTGGAIKSGLIKFFVTELSYSDLKPEKDVLNNTLLDTFFAR